MCTLAITVSRSKMLRQDIKILHHFSKRCAQWDVYVRPDLGVRPIGLRHDPFILPFCPD